MCKLGGITCMLNDDSLGKIRLNVVHDSVDLNLCYDQFGYEIIAF